MNLRQAVTNPNMLNAFLAVSIPRAVPLTQEEKAHPLHKVCVTMSSALPNNLDRNTQGTITAQE